MKGAMISFVLPIIFKFSNQQRGFTDLRKINALRSNDQGTYVDATVAQKPNQGTFPKTGCYRFRGSFFARPDDRSDGVTFLEKQKSDKQIRNKKPKINPPG